MGKGISVVDLVRQVYYEEMKVWLDFIPTDDKFKEVVLQANNVLDELQGEEDWYWLRKQATLGVTGPGPEKVIWNVPSDMYRQSTLFDDGLKLYPFKPCPKDTKCQGFTENGWSAECTGECVIPFSWIVVPWGSAGYRNDVALKQTMLFLRPNVGWHGLTASLQDDKIRFSRPTVGPENHRLIRLEYQRWMEPLHICDSSCVGIDDTAPVSYDPNSFNPCSQLWDTETGKWKIELTEIPDIIYLVLRTACLHAEGDPVATGRVQGLSDRSQMILSSMREHNHAHTTPDMVRHNAPAFINVI